MQALTPILCQSLWILTDHEADNVKTHGALLCNDSHLDGRILFARHLQHVHAVSEHLARGDRIFPACYFASRLTHLQIMNEQEQRYHEDAKKDA